MKQDNVKYVAVTVGVTRTQMPSVVVSLKVELTLQLLLEAPSTRLDQ